MCYAEKQNFILNMGESLNGTQKTILLITLLICVFIIIWVVWYNIKIEITARFYIDVKKRIEELENKKNTIDK